MLLPYVSLIVVLFLPPLRSTLFPYTTLFRSLLLEVAHDKDWKHASIYSIVLQSPVVRPDGDVPGYKHRFLIRNQDILRSEEHTSELQSRGHLVCRRRLEKKPTSESQKTLTSA